jgi:hypothetical protein
MADSSTVTCADAAAGTARPIMTTGIQDSTDLIANPLRREARTDAWDGIRIGPSPW